MYALYVVRQRRGEYAVRTTDPGVCYKNVHQLFHWCDYSLMNGACTLRMSRPFNASYMLSSKSSD